MKNTIVIKKNYEFKNFFSKGKFYKGNFINMYIHFSNNSFNKLGIAVSKKNGKANLRNKIKRLIRENYKNYEKGIKLGTNLLISVNKDIDIKKVSFYDIKNDFVKIMKKADIM